MFNKKLIMQSKTVVNCQTIDDAETLLLWADGEGLRWNSGDKYVGKTNYNYSHNTCYSLHGGAFSYYKKEGYKIISMDDIKTKTKTKTETKIKKDKTMNETDLLGQALTPMVQKVVGAEIEKLGVEAQVKAMLKDVAKNASKILTVKVEGGAKDGKKFPLVHKQFEDLLAVASLQGINTLLTGGAGLSKSTAVEQLAEAFELEMGSISFSNQTTKTDLLGFVDANGIYRKSGFVDAFENGKVFLADEMDACSANVLVLLNSAISNGFIETPDAKVIHVHETFRFVGTANTNLRGSKDGFTARNKLDSATIDRFVVIDWELDKDLEEKLTNNDGWLKIVRKCRKVANEQLEGIVITPRSSYDGAKLLKAGVNVDKVIKMVIVKAMGIDEEESLLKSITANMKASAVKDSNVTPSEEGRELPETKVSVSEVEAKLVGNPPRPEAPVPYREIGDDDVETFAWE